MARSYHIVIAEDSEAVRALLLRMIGNAYPTATLSPVEDGPSAQQIITQGGVDLLITSAQLAQLNGLSLIRALRAQRVAVPILLLSADPALGSIAVRLGADRFLLKPFALHDLNQALQALLP